MPSPQPQQQGIFSLFPSPNSRAVTPTPQELRVGNTPNHDNAQVQQARTARQIQKPPSEVPGRTEATSRSSVAKQPLGDDTAGTLRSIFPAYNPDVPLGQQHYAPTQLGPGPARIPRAVISRQSVHEEQQPESPSPSREPATAARGRWPPRIQTQPTPTPTPPPIPPPCSTADLKSLWRVANGWKASASEGRVFCLRLAQQRDAPVYTLSSGTSQPLWNLRLDPTSASSAYVNLTRHDPSKPPPSSSPSSSSSSTTDTKNWHEALTTTLEEESRRHPPHDGLVALLTPSAAARMAAERAGDAASVAAADNERARLVWDEDTSTHYLVHNALARPFCLTIERSPAYSRTEYTLEHDESPRHIARLTKDGTGGGWVELDTGVASQIASCYVLDVVVASLLLVAAAEDRNSPAPMETFEPPPPAFLAEPSRASGRLGRLSVVRRDDRKKGKKQRSMEEFEIDVESQNDSLGKGRRENRSPEDKLPLLVRAVVKLAEALFSLVIWILTVLFMCVGGVFKVLYKCVGSKY